MKKTNIIIIIMLAIVILAIGIILIINKANKEYNNTLSKEDTFDRFLVLVEDGNYEEAKKYITDTFSTDLSTIKNLKFSVRNRDYDLSNENKFVYIDVYEEGYYKMTTTYSFKLEETNYGWKITNFNDEYSDNMEEVNSLIY